MIRIVRLYQGQRYPLPHSEFRAPDNGWLVWDEQSPGGDFVAGPPDLRHLLLQRSVQKNHRVLSGCLPVTTAAVGS